jgi:pyruvate dehydrogenase E2 component (dihydrolipoamide acetyltransferase)
MTRLAIRMPKMSMTMTEGEVSSWSVKVGDEITDGDIVCEVMTDKVDMDVESPVSGTLVEIVVESGTVAVGEPIGWVEGEDDGGGFGDLLMAPETPDQVEAPVPEPDPVPDVMSQTGTGAPEPEQQRPSGIVPAVPRARGLARELDVDLATVTPTGPGGLVRVADVEALAPATQPATPSAPAAPAPAAESPKPARKQTDRRAAIRAVVARTMTPSAAIPQFTVWRELHLDAANATRKGLSWTTVLLRTYAASLREVPELLSRWEDDRASEAGPPSIALAVATDRGLMVPTFSEPDLGDAADVDAEIREVVASVQKGRMDRAYLGIANGSLSNLGGLGVDRFQALLTPPQGSVLSLGSIKRRPVAVPGGVGTALTVEAGLTVDHRVADGIHAAQLLDRMSNRLNPASSQGSSQGS